MLFFFCIIIFVTAIILYTIVNRRSRVIKAFSFYTVLAFGSDYTNRPTIIFDKKKNEKKEKKRILIKNKRMKWKGKCRVRDTTLFTVRMIVNPRWRSLPVDCIILYGYNIISSSARLALWPGRSIHVLLSNCVYNNNNNIVM